MIATVIVLTALLAPAAAAPDRSSASTLSTDNGNVKFSVGAGKSICFETVGAGKASCDDGKTACSGPYVEWKDGVCSPKAGIYGNAQTANGVVPLEDLATKKDVEKDVGALESKVKKATDALDAGVITTDKKLKDFDTKIDSKLSDFSSRCVTGLTFKSASGKCSPCSTCNYPFEFEKAPPKADSDRVCVKPTVCKAAQEYESIAVGLKSNRECAAFKKCKVGEWTAVKGTPTSDVTCAVWTKCKAAGTEYESAKPTTSTDRICNPVSKCKVGEIEKAKPTTTKDRECGVPDGTDKSNPVESCKALKASVKNAPSGWKWVKAGKRGTIRVWCDQVTAGGGWMLTLLMSTNGKNSPSGHYFPIMSKSPTQMYTSIKHRPSWMNTHGLKPEDRAGLWLHSKATNVRVESVNSGNTVLGDVMTYDKGIKRFQQGNTLWMAASGAAGTSFGKGSITQGTPKPMAQGEIISGYGRKAGDKVNFQMMGDYSCNCWESVHIQNTGSTHTSYQCSPGSGTWKVFGDNGYKSGCWNTASFAYAYARFWIR